MPRTPSATPAALTVALAAVLTLAMSVVLAATGAAPATAQPGTPTSSVLLAATYDQPAEEGLLATATGYALYDLASGATAGFARRPAPGTDAPAYADLSPSGDRVVQIDNLFDEERGQNQPRLTVVQVADGSQSAVLEDVPRQGGDVAWLDAETLMVTDIDAEQTSTVPLDGSPPQVLFEAFAKELTVSPDGSVLWDGEHLRDASGTILHTEQPGGLSEAVWTPDSSSLLWSAGGPSQERALRLLDVATLTSREVARVETPARLMTPVLDPDGEHLYVIRRAGGASYSEEAFQVERRRLDGTGDAEVVWESPTGTQRLTGIASISPDGRYLALYDLGCADAACPGGVLDTTTGQVVLTVDEGRSARFLPAGSPPVEAGDPPGTVRLAGPTRIETAVEISRSTWPDAGAAAAVVATAGNFADAQTATPLAVSEGGPVLLSPTDALHPATAAELQRILPGGSSVYVVGGTAALSEAVAEQVRALGFEVIRLAGDGRGETSVAIAEVVDDDPQEVFVVDGGTFPPGILAGAVAAGRPGAVVVSAGAGAEYAGAHPEATVIQIGESTFPVDADERITATTPTELSVTVAQRFFEPMQRVALASAEAFPDGLAGSAHAAEQGIPVLLTPQAEAPTVLRGFLADTGVGALSVYGGPAAVAASTVRAAVGGSG